MLRTLLVPVNAIIELREQYLLYINKQRSEILKEKCDVFVIGFVFCILLLFHLPLGYQLRVERK